MRLVQIALNRGNSWAPKVALLQCYSLKCKKGTVIYDPTCFIITSICFLALINSSFLAFDSFLTLLSTPSARLLLPNFFWNTNTRGPLPRRYFAPVSPFPWCSANLRATLVVIPVYKLPSRHLTRYKCQSNIILAIKCLTRVVQVGTHPTSLTEKCVYVPDRS